MRRSRIRYLLPLIAVTATSSIVWIAWPRTNPLLDRAVRVASVAGWELGGSYDWISNEEVLFFRPSVKKSAPTAHRLNTRTSEISEDRALTLAIRRIQPSYQWAWPYPEFSLSPDRNHILWRDFGQSPPRSWLIGLGGLRFVRSVTRSRSVWLPDSSGRIEFIHRINEGLECWFYGLEGRGPRMGHLVGGLNQMPETLGFTNEGLILTSNRSYSFGVKSMRLGLFDPTAGGRVKRTFRVTVPPGQQVTGLWLSPRGDKLCWYMDSLAYRRSALPWIERFLMRIGINSTPRKSLCVSRADGSYMRVIGTVEVGPRLIRWLPDNNQISFVVHDALYTMPVD